MADVVEIRQIVVAGDRATQTRDEITTTAVYMVVYDGVDFIPIAALEASGPDPDGNTISIPDMGDVLDGVSPDLAVNRREATRDADSPHIVQVIVNYSSQFEPFPETSSGELSGKWNIDIEAEGIVSTETVSRDRNNVPIKNSANCWYDPPLPKDYYDEKITVSFDTDNLDTELVKLVRGRINDAPVTMTIKGQSRTFETECLKLVDVPYRATLAGAQSAWSVKLVLHYRLPRTIGVGSAAVTYPGWQRLVPDQGYYKLATSGSGGDTVLERIKDSENNGVVTPVYLDGSGQPLDLSTDPEAVLLPFDIDDLADFSELLSGINP